ncbi:FmdB family zinc ribbon protein [Microbacterium amylolyticum]|uniref:FmdB family regulatory protein n=1 Tax=Microbacterium amylolyticum TaxID=936337 RepID=A0ABS4ZJ14_9MICO|nr:FmdB family zinc ribbon protein [Microbacterium amylolyticum]MBP2437277.1 putative FmdB family regulatory protein [Microbacterium amylolyticum]
MPTYAYACADCNHTFDIVQSFADASLTECPQCDGRLRKQYGSIGVTFNGSGFYRTDSRPATSTGTGAASGDSSSSGASSTSTAAQPAAASTSSK